MLDGHPFCTDTTTPTWGKLKSQVLGRDKRALGAGEQVAATDRGFPSKPGIPDRENLMNPKVNNVGTTSPPKPFQGWALVVTSSSSVNYDDRRITDEEVAQLK